MIKEIIKLGLLTAGILTIMLTGPVGVCWAQHGNGAAAATEADAATGPAQQWLAEADASSRLRDAVEFLAGEDCAGRRPGTPGADLAASYLEQVFTGLELALPPESRGYRQGFSITRGIHVTGQPAVSVNGTDLEADRDFTVAGFSGSGTARQVPLVFAGYGIVAPELGWDSYAGLAVTGCAVVIMRGEPQQNDPDSVFSGIQLSVYADLRRKAATARDLGAVAVLIVNNPVDEDDLPELGPTYTAAGFDIPVVYVKRELLVNALIGTTGLSWHEIAETIDLENQPQSAVVQDTLIDIDVAVEKDLATGFNIIGVIPGTEPALAGQYVVLGAHYDHLGIGGPESTTPERYGEIHPGADDNASGVAAVLEIARQLTANPPARSVLVSLFSAEELGLLGSSALVRNAVVPVESIHSMINLDMIGHLRDGRLIVGGVDSAEELAGIIEAPAAAHSLALDSDLSGLGGSDHMSFMREGIPSLFLNTGAFAGYHSPADTAAGVNYDGLLQVAAFAGDVTVSLADWPEPLAFNEAARPAPAQGSNRGNLRVSMGTVPHYGGELPVAGMGVGDVVAGGPAEAAGIQGGDVIIKILDRRIANIYDFMYVLQDCTAGQVVPVTVWRDGAELTLDVELASRNVQH
ncbi:M20/M25/M40 family metallo-hydrolase [bacterium]|nr:M20/M25/M40 family metallo-hydrolase [bacterium]